MTDKPLSEQIEEAGADEFVKFARRMAHQIKPEPSQLLNYQDWGTWINDFNQPFVNCFNHEESHIAAAIMLADAIEGYETDIETVPHGFFKCSIYSKIGIEYFEATHRVRAMALLAAIAKKVESEC